MFSDESFAGMSFSDVFLNFNRPISYVFRRGRTLVASIVAEEGEVFSGVSSRIIRTQVEEACIESGIPYTNVVVRIVRTKVTPITARSGVLT